MSVTRNPALSRYELAVDGETAFAVYREAPGIAVITHTEVPKHLRGRGIGAKLVRGVLEDISARGLKVEPRCPFVAAFIARNPEFRELLN
jgi:predicted GNAT family acetyltransferase